MAELRLGVDSPRRGFDPGIWALRCGLALVFVAFGLEKFPSTPASPWVKVFGLLGLGQWFRYATGIFEVLGAVLLLIPAATTPATLILGCTMIGAIGFHVFVARDPVSSLMPAVFLAAIVGVWSRHRAAVANRTG